MLSLGNRFGSTYNCALSWTNSSFGRIRPPTIDAKIDYTISAWFL